MATKRVDRMSSRRYRATALAALAAALTAGCATGTRPPEPTAAPTVRGWETAAIATLGAVPPPVPVKLGLPYKPDVQFTPIYVAQKRGYFERGGLVPQLEYGDESNLLRQVAMRQLTATIASGEQVILARSQGVPVKYILTWYQRYPGAVFSLDPALQTPADLVGKQVGLPSSQGASFTGWQALLAKNKIDPTSVGTEVIGYRQLDAVLQGQVDAAVGYATNEPVQLRRMGRQPTVIEIADSFNLVSNGLVVADGLIDETPEAVQALVDAMLAGIRDTLDDPDAAFEVALETVPEAADPQVRDGQRAVLDESLRFWNAPRLGAIDGLLWEESQGFLQSVGFIEQPAPIDELVDARFVDAASAGR